MKDIVFEHSVTKRVVRLTAAYVTPAVFKRCIIEVRVGGLESACAYLNSVGIWARVAQFNEASDHATFSL